MRLSRLFGKVAKHADSNTRESSNSLGGLGGNLFKPDGEASSGAGRPAEAPKKAQIEVEVEPGLFFRSNPSMLIEMPPVHPAKKIFPIIKQADGKWRYALQGGNSGFSYVDSKIAEQIDQAMFTFINQTIVT